MIEFEKIFTHREFELVILKPERFENLSALYLACFEMLIEKKLSVIRNLSQDYSRTIGDIGIIYKDQFNL